MAKSLKTSVQLDTRKAVSSLEKLEKKLNNIQAAIERQNKVTNSLNNASNKLVNTNNKVAQSSNKATAAHNKQSKAVSSLTTKVHRLANAYLGVMGGKAIVTSSDTITKAENKLNNLKGGNPQATQLAMDKMYVASQGARTGYGDMINNVSKSMTLAGKAFGDNIDNAIRFQEIMAKSYSVGGASAAEQSSSMYQMIQALGSGILQGDELRSVREGAPLAYKAIEEFAQGIYGAEENLKDLASQGKITSDIVVAAIMSAGDQIDAQFANTEMTFEQAWTNIKNMTLKSFEPVLKMLNDALNYLAENGAFEKIGMAIQFVAGTIQLVFGWIAKIYNFVADNWETISDIILTIGAIIAISLIPKFIAWLSYLKFVITYYTYVGAAAVASAIRTAAAWVVANWQLALILVVLALIVITIIWVADSFVDACGIIAGSIAVVGAVIFNIIAWVINAFAVLVTFITVGAYNIGVALYNAWQSAKISFWEWVSECLNGTSLIAQAVSKIASIFGLDGATIDTYINDAQNKMKEPEDLQAALKDASNFIEYMNVGDAYADGYDWGTKVGQGISDKVSGVGNWIKDKLGLDNLSNLTNGASGVGGAYSIPDNLGKIADDTGDISKKMDLTEEDLKYLRDLAEQEWKKEFTTATIQVDMSNYNTVNGDSDLDGIATRLADKLYEELHSVANGVYA